MLYYRIKIVFWLTGFLSCVQLPAFCQVNEYLNHNPVWLINSQCALPYPCIQNENYNYYTNGDTLFNGLTYKKIFRKGEGFYSWMGPPPPGPGCSGSYSYTAPGPSYFVRSDYKQMYIRQLSDTNEYLLYDFDLAVGDTLPLTFNNFLPYTTVTAVDSISTPYGYRKRFSLSGNTWSMELLEGIGHDRGFIEPLNTPLECGFTLNCFSLNDSAYYPVPGPTCELNVGLDENPDPGVSVNVFPNPFKEFTYISWVSTLPGAEFRVFNLQGKMVRAVREISGNGIKLERGDLEAGSYLFELRRAGNLMGNGKLMIFD
jgi:hypothetical protein